MDSLLKSFENFKVFCSLFIRFYPHYRKTFRSSEAVGQQETESNISPTISKNNRLLVF